MCLRDGAGGYRRNERALSLYRRSLKYLLIPYVLWSIVYTLLDPKIFPFDVNIVGSSRASTSSSGRSARRRSA